MIYFDHGSTSIPKATQAVKNIYDFLIHNGTSPGRGGHFLAAQSEKQAHQCRQEIRRLLKVPDDLGVVSFTLNATHGLNIIIKGLLQEGDHVITTSLEHNSVLRPIQNMVERKKISWDTLWANSNGAFELQELKKLFRPETKLLVINHISNVIGSIAPIEPLVQAAHQNGTLVLLDVSQSLASIPLEIEKWNVDFVAATGHKGLRAPQGIGFNYFKNPDLITTFIEGGSGQNSISPYHPQFGSDKFEAGTPNIVGIAGLLGAIAEFNERDLFHDQQKKIDLFLYATHELKKIPEVKIYQAQNIKSQAPLFSFNIQGALPQNVAFMLERDYKILTRPGLHCAPLAHKSIGTFPNGSIRISFGIQNNAAEIDFFIKAIKDITQRIYDKTSQRQSAKDHSKKVS